MRKIIIAMAVSLIIFLNYTNLVFAKIDPTGVVIPCGMAGAPDGSDKCCYIPPVNLPNAPNVPDLFGVKDKYNEIKNSLEEFQQKNPTHPCIYGEPSTTNLADPSCKCILSITPTVIPAVSDLCNKYLTGKDQAYCIACASGGGIWTAIACVPLTIESFITDFVLRTGIGLAGIIALLCVIYAAFQMQASQGNPEKIKKAQELLTSCIMGLLLIIFSVFILRLIGVDILKIPGFK